jgi:hypothetical protein
MPDEQQDIEEEAIEHLERIEQDLEEIKNRTPNRRNSFVYGFWHGVGALVGGIIGLTLLGWLLSIFGVIPGFDQIVPYLQAMVDNLHRP